MLEQGWSVRSEERQRQCVKNWSHSPSSPSPCTTQGEEAEMPGLKLNLGRREGWGKLSFFLTILL